MAKVFGLCNMHDSPSLGKLTEKRPIGTVSFLGRYGLMDFALSNFSNSGIDRVGILVDKSMHSVISHVRDGSIWINNTKTGSQRIFFNENIPSKKFNTDINNLLANRLHFETEDVDYVVVAPAFFLMSIDFRKYIEKHIESGRDISIIYKKVKNAKEAFFNCDVLKVENHTVKDFSVNFGRAKEANISLETFIFTFKTFVQLINHAREISTLFNIRDLVNYVATNNLYEVNAFSFDGYVAPILTFDGHPPTPRSSAQKTSAPREATWTKNAPGIRPLAKRIGPAERCSGLSTLLVRPSGTPRPDTLRPRRCFTLF